MSRRMIELLCWFVRGEAEHNRGEVRSSIWVAVCQCLPGEVAVGEVLCCSAVPAYVAWMVVVPRPQKCEVNVVKRGLVSVRDDVVDRR